MIALCPLLPRAWRPSMHSVLRSLPPALCNYYFRVPESDIRWRVRVETREGAHASRGIAPPCSVSAHHIMLHASYMYTARGPPRFALREALFPVRPLPSQTATHGVAAAQWNGGGFSCMQVPKDARLFLLENEM